MTTIDTLPAKTRGPRRPPNLQPHRKTAAVVAIVGAAVLAWAVADGLHLDMLFAQPLVIQLHVYAALAAFALGTVIVLARKGRTFHIRAGWTWVGLMAVTAGASLFITGINGDYWSWIHVLSGSTLLMLPFGVMAARKHNIGSHRGLMLGLYFGGMVIAGGFTFLPGRLMWRIVFG